MAKSTVATILKNKEAIRVGDVATHVKKQLKQPVAVNQSWGAYARGTRFLAYLTAPLLAVTSRESPCKLPSYTE